MHVTPHSSLRCSLCPASTTPAPAPLICLLATDWRCLLWTLMEVGSHRIRSPGVWLLLLSTRVFIAIRAAAYMGMFLFIAAYSMAFQTHCCLSVLPLLMDIWAVSRSGLRWIKLLGHLDLALVWA